MGRVNKTIDGVFTDIVGNTEEISTYNQFITHGDKFKPSKELKGITDMYVRLVNNNKKTFEQLAGLEEIIMQMRIRENLENIKLSLVRDYIYARTPFYRKDRKAKDVRVIVDKLEFHPHIRKNLKKLLGNEEFMTKAKVKLGEAMDKEIRDNIEALKSSVKGKVFGNG